MHIEKWGNKSVDKESLRVSGKIESAPMKISDVAENVSAAEKIIGASDSASREELMFALSQMMNIIGEPESVLDEIIEDEAKKNQANILAAEYNTAVVALDKAGKKQAAEKLRQLIG